MLNRASCENWGVSHREVKPDARAHEPVVAFLLAMEQKSNLSGNLSGSTHFLNLCEGSLAHAEKPFETFHGLHKDVMVSGFWLRNEMGVTEMLPQKQKRWYNEGALRSRLHARIIARVVGRKSI